MRNSFGIAAILWFSGVLGSIAHASTVITEQNITRYEAALPELARIEQDDPSSLKYLRLAKHCDWALHASELRAKEQGKGYLAQVDQVLTKHQLTPALFIELTAKGAWPVLQSMQPVLAMTEQSLPFLPETQRKLAEQKIAQTNQMRGVIGPCLTDADKRALQQYQQRFINLATGLPGLAF
ncbi:hypothetical protein [Alishewanella tabrizica]|uniref:Uncharacterized protein n=1 Tax=Alishewanella tabrizica TaxID=671278 RepID=A0ABQ2WL80_9ALTE|nr:hypothetical protein [Alishewanella tabrizica]GGW59089.1 hypothetical protein GCM10008111_13960 [Alishewanella tabrizica]